MNISKPNTLSKNMHCKITLQLISTPKAGRYCFVLLLEKMNLKIKPATNIAYLPSTYFLSYVNASMFAYTWDNAMQITISFVVHYVYLFTVLQWTEYILSSWTLVWVEKQTTKFNKSIVPPGNNVRNCMNKLWGN